MNPSASIVLNSALKAHLRVLSELIERIEDDLCPDAFLEEFVQAQGKVVGELQRARNEKNDEADAELVAGAMTSGERLTRKEIQRRLKGKIGKQRLNRALYNSGNFLRVDAGDITPHWCLNDGEAVYL